MAANALELSRHGVPKKPFYLNGPGGGQAVQRASGGRSGDLAACGRRALGDRTRAAGHGSAGSGVTSGAGLSARRTDADGALPEELPPGVSALDEYLAQRLTPEAGGEA